MEIGDVTTTKTQINIQLLLYSIRIGYYIVRKSNQTKVEHRIWTCGSQWCRTER